DSLSSEIFVLQSGTNWQTLNSSPSPSAREGHLMTLHDGLNKIVLFGGYDGVGFLSGTWLLDGGGWSFLNQISPSPPSARAYAGAAYDEVRSRIVMFGGKDSGGAIGETWVFTSAEEWNQLSPTVSPSARHSSAMAWMESLDTVVLFGGIDGSGNVLGDTWFFDSDAGIWIRHISSAVPPPRYAASMAYDGFRKRVTLFGGLNDGHQPLSDIWEFDGTDWYEVLRSEALSARAGHQVVFNPSLDRMILFGGASGIGRVTGAPATSGVRDDLFQLSFEAPRLLRAIFLKSSFTTPGDPVTSDRLHLTFSQEMRINERTPSGNPFFLPVSGDSLGSGFAMELSPLNARQVIVTLGASPTLTPDGVSTPGVVTPGSPSSIDVAAAQPSSKPLVSRSGVPPVDIGLAGLDDTGLDVEEMLGSNERIFSGTVGGTLSVVQATGLAFQKHSVYVPDGTFGAGEEWKFIIEPVIEDIEVASGFTLRVIEQTGGMALAETGDVVFSNPITITMEYQEGDFNPEQAEEESLMRIHRLVELTTGTLALEPVLDATGAPQNQNFVTNTVSVQVNGLSGGVETFYCIPLDIVNESRINIAPSAGSSVHLSVGSVSLVPGIDRYGNPSIYTRHLIEIPNYTMVASGGTTLTIRKATPPELQAFPISSNAIFSVTAQNAGGEGVSFSVPVNLTVEYKVPGDLYVPSGDLRDFTGAPVAEADMSILRRDSGENSFVFQNGGTVDTTSNTVRIMGVTNLTRGGIGTWATVGAGPGTAPLIAPIDDHSTLAGSPFIGPTPSLAQGTLPVTWTLVAGPLGMTIDDSTGMVSWNLPTWTGPPYTVTIRATNSAGYDEESWQLSVTPVGVPVIGAIADHSTVAGSPYTGPTPSLTQGSLPVTWSLVSGPSGMTINASTGVVLWPAPTVTGSPHTVTIRATNSVGSDDESWLLTVAAMVGATCWSLYY
ncbi:MAG: kelch repeat-containing protein, partial [bacterium]